MNRGVAGGYNLGRTAASGELIVMIHDDVEVEPGWLRAWVDATDRYPDAGVVGSKVLFPDGRLRGAGSILWRDATTSPPWHGESPSPETFDTPRLIDYSASCSLLVRAETWDAMGGLDDEFFPAYYVDVDVAMSARRLGWSVVYWPGSCVRHRGGDSRQLRWRSFVWARNWRRFVERWNDDLQRQPVNDGNIEAAVALAASWSPPAPGSPLPPRSTADRDDSFYLTLEGELNTSYIRHLETTLDDAEQQLAELRDARPSQ